MLRSARLHGSTWMTMPGVLQLHAGVGERTDGDLASSRGDPVVGGHGRHDRGREQRSYQSGSVDHCVLLRRVHCGRVLAFYVLRSSFSFYVLRSAFIASALAAGSVS